MDNLNLDIPLSIFAAGCITSLLAAFGIFSPPITQAMYIIGTSIGSIGIVAGLIVFCMYKMKGSHKQDD